MIKDMTMVKTHRFTLAALACALLSTSTSPLADERATVVSTVPAIHSLILILTQGTNITPKLLLDKSDTLHDIMITPSKARLLRDSDLVVVLGHGEPEALSHENLEGIRGGDDGIIRLIDHVAPADLIENCHVHDHGNSDDHDAHGDDDEHDEHGHDEADDHHDLDHDSRGHDDDHDDHVHDDEHEDGHHFSCVDEHVWLSTSHAKTMVRAISQRLIEGGLENETALRGNLVASLKMLEELETEIGETLKGFDSNAHTTHIVAWHDAYRYFRNSHNLPEYLDGQQSDVHSAAPSGKKLAGIFAHLEKSQQHCVVFGSSQSKEANTDLFSTLPGIRLVVADPLYVHNQVNQNSYRDMMLGIAKAFASCL